MSTIPPASTPPGPAAPLPPEGPGFLARSWRWIKRTLWMVLFAVIIVAALWTWLSLSFDYSSGERTGVVQKFSKSGWLCKTWEGQLAMVNYPGSMPEVFHFSVRDDAAAAEINRLLGQRVRLHYEQHKFVPTTCFGETEYFVNKAEPLEDQKPPGY
jgi:hypothetical protein